MEHGAADRNPAKNPQVDLRCKTRSADGDKFKGKHE